MDVSIFIQLARVHLAVKNHAVAAAVKICFTQLPSLTPGFLFDFRETVFDAGHDSDVKWVHSTVRNRSCKGLVFPSIFSNVKFDWSCIHIFLVAGLVCWDTRRLEMGVDMTRQGDL